MLRSGEYGEEATKHDLEAPLRILWREVGRGQLLTDNQSKFRNQVHHQLAIRAKSLQQKLPPVPQLSFALDEQPADQSLEGLCECRVRDTALVLVEFARRKKPARWNQHPMQLVDHRRLTDSGIARHQHQANAAVSHDTVKGGKQNADLAFATIQLFRNQQPIRGSMRG